MYKYMKIIKAFLASFIIFFLLFGVLFLRVEKANSWVKDSGITCERAFASITNETGARDWEGQVNANSVNVVSTSGTAASNEKVTVEWTPTSGFSGTVTARIRLFNAQHQVEDTSTITARLYCPVTVTPTPSVPVTPPTTQPPAGPPSAPSYNCPFVVGEVPWFRVEQGAPNDGQLELLWSDVQSANKVNVYYGENSGNMTHSVIKIEDNGHFTVGGLVNGQHYFFQLEGIQDGCSGPRTAEFDPLP